MNSSWGYNFGKSEVEGPWALLAEKRVKGVARTGKNLVSFLIFAYGLVWSWRATENSLGRCHGSSVMLLALLLCYGVLL